MTDIEIAQAHEMKKIVDVAAKAGIDEKHLELYGNYKSHGYKSFTFIQDDD